MHDTATASTSGEVTFLTAITGTVDEMSDLIAPRTFCPGRAPHEWRLATRPWQ